MFDNEIETPSQEVFDEMKEIATKLWKTYDNTYGYVDEKIDVINGFGNVQDNAMIFYRMFDNQNQIKFRNYTGPSTDIYINNNK